MSLPRLFRTGEAAYSLLMPSLSVALIRWRNCQRFSWPTFSFLSILAFASSKNREHKLLITFTSHSITWLFYWVKGHNVQASNSAHQVYLNSRTVCDKFTIIAFQLFLLPPPPFPPTPHGRPVMSDVSPVSGISGLSFDPTSLSPLFFSSLVLLPFLSYLFFFFFLPAGPFI